MPTEILKVTDLTKSFGAVRATSAFHLDVVEGEVHALIGPNGAGKTTLIAQISGEIAPDSGVIVFRGDDITRLSIQQRAARGLARSFQITSVFPEFTALQNVAIAVQSTRGHSFRFLRRYAADDAILAPARDYLARVGLDQRAKVTAAELAHGERRQLELAMALALEPTLLLLDEPMAGMGRDDSGRMLALLASLKSKITMLLVEHDMDVVFSLSDRVTVMAYGATIATGNAAEIQAHPEVRKAYLGGD